MNKKEWHIVYFPIEGIYEIWEWGKFIAGPFHSWKAANQWRNEQ